MTTFDDNRPYVPPGGQPDNGGTRAPDDGSPRTGEGRPKIKLPDDYTDEGAFLNDMRETFGLDSTDDFLNMQAAIEDLQFLGGAQWDPASMQRRAQNKKPILTINRLPAFVGQVVGNRRLNETVIRVLPDQGGTKAIARVRQGLIRSIEKNSNADTAYDSALQQSAACGIGNFRIVSDYAGYDVFEQDLKIEELPDPSCVVWDRTMIDKTGRDAKHVFVQDIMARKDFVRAWPWAQPADLGSDLIFTNTLAATGWFTQDIVRVVSYWRMRHDKRTVALMQNGCVEDVTEKPREEWAAKVAVHPRTGDPYIREANRPYAEMYLCTATNILAGPYRLYTYRVPVFRVPGWEVRVAGAKLRWGLIRFLKDPQRFFNYWRSTVVEKMMMAPKAKYLVGKKAIGGLEDKWRNAHLTEDPLLVWNDEESANRPEMLPPVQMEPALMDQAGMAGQDMRDVSNMHEASLGIQSNEVSGKAVLARQRVGELGTVIYTDNLADAQEEAGRVLNDLIPSHYDTPRTVKTLGEDGKADLVKINYGEGDPNGGGSIDITSGKYSVTVTTGPSYATKRVEAVESLQAFVNAAPDTMQFALPVILENLDIPGAEQMAATLRKTLPPEMQDTEDMDEAQLAELEQRKQQMGQQAALEQATAEATLKKLDAEIAEIGARAAESGARQALVEQQIEKLKADTSKVQMETAVSAVEADKVDAETQRTHAETHNIGAQTEQIYMNDDLERQRIEVEKTKAKEKPVAPGK